MKQKVKLQGAGPGKLSDSTGRLFIVIMEKEKKNTSSPRLRKLNWMPKNRKIKIGEITAAVDRYAGQNGTDFPRAD